MVGLTRLPDVIDRFPGNMHEEAPSVITLATKAWSAVRTGLRTPGGHIIVLDRFERSTQIRLHIPHLQDAFVQGENAGLVDLRPFDLEQRTAVQRLSTGPIKVSASQ